MSQWGDKPTPDNVPNYLTDEQKAQAKATDRGWEIPLAGTNPDKGLTEVIVAIGSLASRTDEGEVVIGFDVFDIDQWSVPVKVPAAREPSVFETETFKNNTVLKVGVRAADFDTDYPNLEDYAHQREVMHIGLPDGGLTLTADNTITGTLRVYVDEQMIDETKAGVIGIVLPIVDASDAYVTSAMMALSFQNGDIAYWGPDAPDYISPATAQDAATLKQKKYAALGVRISAGTIEFLVNGKKVAEQTGLTGVVAGCKVLTAEISTINGNSDVDYRVDDLTVTD